MEASAPELSLDMGLEPLAGFTFRIWNDTERSFAWPLRTDSRMTANREVQTSCRTLSLSLSLSRSHLNPLTVTNANVTPDATTTTDDDFKHISARTPPPPGVYTQVPKQSKLF